MDNLENIKYPICPINMFFEGDEDKCDESKCDFDLEVRRCSEACRIGVKELQKEVDKVKPKENAAYPEELEVVPNVNKSNLFGIFPVPSDMDYQDRWGNSLGESFVLAECSNLDFARELVHRSNNFPSLLIVCESNISFVKRLKPLFENYTDSPAAMDMIKVLDDIVKFNENAITQATKRR